MNSTKKKAVALISGGLDSVLAVRLLLDQGFQVWGVCFVSPLTIHAPLAKRDLSAVNLAKSLGVSLHIQSLGREFFQVLRSPRFGYGREMNPCVDCKILMLQKASAFGQKMGIDLVVTGEVLGQRPMSQNLQALSLIEKESGLQGRLLRPLCAKLLPPTEAEELGLVDRDRLLALGGRTRKPQLGLAEEWGIEGFSSPAGGCLLTDPVVASRLRDLMKHQPDFDCVHARLLTLGRQFRTRRGLKVIVGRHERENELLHRFSDRFAFLELAHQPGPLMLALGSVELEDRELLGGMLWTYAKKAQGERMAVRSFFRGVEQVFWVDKKATLEQLQALRI